MTYDLLIVFISSSQDISLSFLPKYYTYSLYFFCISAKRARKRANSSGGASYPLDDQTEGGGSSFPPDFERGIARTPLETAPAIFEPESFKWCTSIYESTKLFFYLIHTLIFKSMLELHLSISLSRHNLPSLKSDCKVLQRLTLLRT